MPCGAGLAPLDVARFAADEIGLIGQEVGVGADHREGRAQLMGDERDQLAACLVDRLERLDACLGLGLLAALLDDPGQQVGDRAELGHVVGREIAGDLRLHVEHPHDLVVPRQGHAEHRSDEAALVDAAYPQEPGIGLDVSDDRRLVGRRDPAGDTLPERHARPADLEAVEPVGRGEGQVRSIPVKEVQRGDIRVQRVAGPVDHGLEQLVPCPRGRGEPRDLVQEAQLLELVRGGRRQAAHIVSVHRRAGRMRAGALGALGCQIGHGDHDTSVGNERRPKGCDEVVRAVRYGPWRTAA